MARIYSKKSHCLNGHEKTPENTDSNYSCKLCKSMRDAARHPRLTKVCAWCACEFTGRADQEYCNRKCLDKAKNRRKSKVTDKRREELHVEAEKRSAWKLDHPGERWYAYKTMSSEEKKAYYRKNNRAGSLEQRRAKARRKANSPAGKARSAATRHRRRARIKGNGGSWTGKQWVALKAAHEGKCLGWQNGNRGNLHGKETGSRSCQALITLRGKLHREPAATLPWGWLQLQHVKEC